MVISFYPWRKSGIFYFTHRIISVITTLLQFVKRLIPIFLSKNHRNCYLSTINNSSRFSYKFFKKLFSLIKKADRGPLQPSIYSVITNYPIHAITILPRKIQIM